MITLLGVSYAIPKRAFPQVLFEGLNIHIEPFERVGIVALSGAGKTTLARLISGMLRPTKGHVVCNGKVSPPIGYGAAIHPELTIRQNIEIITRANGDDPMETLRLCSWLGRLETQLDQPVKNVNTKDKRSLSHCISLASANDMFIADESLIFGDEHQRKEAAELLDIQLQSAGLVFISSNAAQLKKTCDRFYKLADGSLYECLDVVEAAEELEFAQSRLSRETRPANIDQHMKPRHLRT